MYRLKKDNIIKETDSKVQKIKLEAAGFELIEEEDNSESKAGKGSSKKGNKKPEQAAEPDKDKKDDQDKEDDVKDSSDAGDR